MIVLARIVERMARLAPQRHRELVRAMMAELDSIEDPAERLRFALGAIVAIGRLALPRFGRATVPGEPVGSGKYGGPSMSKLTARQLLRRHVTPFVVSVASLTGLFLAQDAGRWTRQLSARGAPEGAIAEVLLLALPHTLALTIPMAVFLAVSWVFTRLGAEGVLASVRRERRGLRRLTVPVLGAATVVAALMLLTYSEVLPRANARLTEVLEGAPREPTDRTMTIGELRAAAQSARATDGAEAAVRANQIEVEIQKKLAIPAACVILALAAAVIPLRFPRGGGKLVLAASNLVFMGYFALLVTGESLADRRLLSPVIAMWMANAILLAVALVMVRLPRLRPPTQGSETLAIDG
jgi:lipopolysaccharide export LptBFGC system permease protein LptF